MRPVQTSSSDVAAVWRAAEEETRAIRGMSLGARGSTLTLTFPGAGVVVANHKLGRQPVGWVVVDKSATADVWRTAWTTTTISLQASAATAVSVVVY